MTREEIISGLQMTMALVQIDPATGNVRPVYTMNDLDKTTYLACKEAIKILKAQDVPDTNVSNNDDTIYRQMAIELIERMKPYHQEADDIAEMIANMPSAQPDMSEYSSKLWRNAYERGKRDAQSEEDCDTCKHGYFGDDQCNNCRVRYPSHYERRTDD